MSIGSGAGPENSGVPVNESSPIKPTFSAEELRARADEQLKKLEELQNTQPSQVQPERGEQTPPDGSYEAAQRSFEVVMGAGVGATASEAFYTPAELAQKHPGFQQVIEQGKLNGKIGEFGFEYTDQDGREAYFLVDPVTGNRVAFTSEMGAILMGRGMSDAELNAIDPQTSASMEELKKGGRLGEDVTEGRHIFYFKDPKTGERLGNVTFDPASRGKVENTARVNWPPIPGGTPLEVVEDTVNRYLWKVERMTGTGGFEEEDLRKELLDVVGDAMWSRPLPEQARAVSYADARMVLDRAIRAYESAIKTQEKESIGKFALAALRLNKDRRDRLEEMIPLSPGAASRANSAVALAEAEIRQYQGKYFSAGTAPHEYVRNRLLAAAKVNPHPGFNEQQAEIAVTLAENILKVSREAERYGKNMLNDYPKTKGRLESEKQMRENVTGLLGKIFGLGK